MAKVTIVRKHRLTFQEAKQLAQLWMIEGEEKYDLVGEYIEDGKQSMISFSRKGLSGILTVNQQQFKLELTLGFLFSAYKKRIIETINHNMDKLLNSSS